MTLLSGAMQPQLLTLLNTSSSPSISSIWRTHTDLTLPADSYITTLPDTASRPLSKWDQPPGMTFVPKHPPAKGNIEGQIVHLQSPDIGGTWIQAGLSVTEHRRRREKARSTGPSGHQPEEELAVPLGIELGWVGLQIKRLGRRHFAIEFGMVDGRGREGVVRCSTFKKEPTIHPYRTPPLIHLPLVLPDTTASTLTPWLDVTISLAPLIPLFHSLRRPSPDHSSGSGPRKKRKTADLPAGELASVSYVRVYANCRVRRVWFSAEGERTLGSMGGVLRDEWAIYAAAATPE